MENEDDDLEMLLGVQFEGLERALAYAAALRDIVRQNERLARVLDKVNAALATAASLREGATPTLPSIPMPGVPTATDRAPVGPNARLAYAKRQLEKLGKDATPEKIEDAQIAYRRAQSSVESARRASMTPEMQALYSTRINLPGGAAPLLGKTLEASIGPAATRGVLAAFAPVARVLVPFGLSVSLAKVALQGMYDAAMASAEAVNRVTAARAGSGGTVADVTRAGLMGANPDAARSFNERISRDPLAMSMAGSIGIRNLPGIYGKKNWARQYLDAIERTASIGNEAQRRNLELSLGIEQEVAQYALLSQSARKRIKEQAADTEQIVDPNSQKIAAELSASTKGAKQALDNLGVAFSELFSEELTAQLNNFADNITGLAKWLKSLRGPQFKQYDTLLGALTGGLLGDPGHTAQANKQTPLMANTLALQGNTAAMERLTGIYGGGTYSREALPSALRGQQLHEAIVTQTLRRGALG